MNKKITVTIEPRSGLLSLRWNDGNRRRLSLGLRDTPPNRALAEVKKKSIEQDWANETYDPSNFTYKPQTTGSNATDITAPELFKRFTAHKLREGNISEHTASARYRNIQLTLKTHLDKPVSEIGFHSAEALSDLFAKTLSPQVSKAQLTLLKACWSWGVGKYQVAERNPFEGFNGRFKSIPKKAIEPFTRDEVKAIISGFKNSEKYTHYTDFVTFLFGTGCRLGEVVALTWADIKPNYSAVFIGKSTTGKFQNPTTKTGKARNVLLSQSIATMLKARSLAINPKDTDLIFLEKDRGSIDNRVFLNRWKKVLASAGVKYRKPYSTRHTAISHALENGANPIDVAGQCGHDVGTLFEFYAHVIQQKQVFTEFS
jgi:integrase